MNSTSKENRILGAQEILFCAMNESSQKHFLVAAEIEDSTNKADWEIAVPQLQKTHPMLNVSIIAEGDDLVFSPSHLPLSLEINELTAAFDLAAAMENELEKGFRSDRGPLARVSLFHSAEKCVLIIAAHHSISDALSSVNLIDDLLGLLSGNTLKALPVQPSVDEFLDNDNQGLAAKINVQPQPGTPLPREFPRQHPAAKVQILHFSTELTALLTETVKKENTTAHGALQAASALAIKEIAFQTGCPAYTMSPFSVRKEMNIGKPTLTFNCGSHSFRVVPKSYLNN